MIEENTFGWAIWHLNQGLPLARVGWNGKGIFVFKQVSCTVPEEVIPNMQSVPKPVKDILIQRGGGVSYSNQYALVTREGDIHGWSPSVSDTLAGDWYVYQDPIKEGGDAI